MRPNHFGIYGYHRNTTPNMDRIAKEGVRFSRAYCANSPCVPSRASFASGLFGIHSGVVNHNSANYNFRYLNDSARPMFIRHLRNHGYKSATFSSFADRHDAFWFMAGWNEVHTHTLKRGNENADEVVAEVLPWLKEHAKEDDYFLHIQLWDPHRNYTMPNQYPEMFRNEPPPAWPDKDAIQKHQDNYAPFSAAMLFPLQHKSRCETMPDHINNVRDFKMFVDSYDGAIRFMDEQLGKIFNTLEEFGIMEETAVIISADHGEGMGEHGIYGDHVCADEAVHHIPMIIKWPGIKQKDVEHNELVYNVDLIATIVDLLNINVPEKWDGRSFANILRGGEYISRDYLVWEHGFYSAGRSVRTDDWLMMRTYHPGLVPLEPIELYNMKLDPFLTNNVANEHPAEIEKLDQLLQEWLQEQLGLSDLDPLAAVVEAGPFPWIKKEQWAQYLRHVGREDLAEQYLCNIGEQSRFKYKME
jgi:choline-sulfatase